jgi:hypothetical protein
MNGTMRLVLGVVAGAVVAVACIFGIEMAGHAVYPPPPGTDVTDPEQLKELMRIVPTGALVIVALAWFAGSLVGAWVANLVAQRAVAGWIVALLIVAGGVSTMIGIPHPAWLWACGILLPLLAAQIAQMTGKRPSRP